MKDMIGNDVFPKDVLLELRLGGGWDGKIRTYPLKIWEMPENKFDGHAYAYNINGSRYEYAWAYLQSAVKLNQEEMPDGFMFSFYHGMSDLETTLEKGELLDIIESSNWHRKMIKKEDVEEYDEADKIILSSKKDVFDNVDTLRNSKFINYKIMKKVLDLFGIDENKAVNGESGIAMMYDIQNYSAILYEVKYGPEKYE